MHIIKDLHYECKTIYLSMRLWGITTEFVGFIAQSLMLRSIVLDLSLIYMEIGLLLILNIIDE